eukprot:SM000004S15032  [mRNA]  locus=s4:928006:936864:+ [translate_table: standard]
MKRKGEDGVAGQHSKRPAGAAAKQEPASEAPLAPGGSRLTTDDALAYLKAVKEKFKDDKDKYNEFLEVMKDFKAQRIDTSGVIARVKDLFRGHRPLILGFNTFLPKGFEITLPPEDDGGGGGAPKKQPVEFDQAISYVNKIKTRFQADEHVYKAFLEILNHYRKGNKSISEVYQEVASLFQDHSDLLDEFTYFLPDSTGPPPPSTAAGAAPMHAPAAARQPLGGGAGGAGRPDKQGGGGVSGGNGPLGYHAGEKPPKKVKVGPSERGGQRNVQLDPDKAFARAERERLKRSEKERERQQQQKDRDSAAAGDGGGGGGGGDDPDDPRLPHKRKSARRADELIRRQAHGPEAGAAAADDGMDAVETSGMAAAPVALGPAAAAVAATAGAVNQSAEDKKIATSLRMLLLQHLSTTPRGASAATLVKELGFFERVKGRLRNREAYNEFLKCLNLFSKDIIGRTELQSLVSDLLGRFPDLLDGFSDFLSRCENLEESDLAEALSGKPVKVERERERDRERELAIRDRERSERSERPMPTAAAKDGGVVSHKGGGLAPSGGGGKDKYMYKPISELDLSGWERCTPSYRLLPKNYPRAISSHRTELGQRVLNDHWVSVTSGSEDYSFKHMRKNQYEESLFRCEDDRFELDMLLESTSVTARRVAEIVNKLHVMPTEEKAAFHIDDHLNAINLRWIERIYGDHGLDILELLRRNCALALPVVLNRLQQKQEEWLKCQDEMNKVWGEVYAKNYHKSLDHRSFYFKQQDKKSLSTKGLLAEIREIAEQRRQEDATMSVIAAGSGRPLLPDLTFEYVDDSIHEDLFKIVKFSAEEVCTSAEQSRKLMRLWATFLEPLLGIQSTHLAALDDEDNDDGPAAGPREGEDGEDDGEHERGDDEEEEHEDEAEGAGGGAAEEDEEEEPHSSSPEMADIPANPLLHKQAAEAAASVDAAVVLEASSAKESRPDDKGKGVDEVKEPVRGEAHEEAKLAAEPASSEAMERGPENSAPKGLPEVAGVASVAPAGDAAVAARDSVLSSRVGAAKGDKPTELQSGDHAPPCEEATSTLSPRPSAYETKPAVKEETAGMADGAAQTPAVANVVVSAAAKHEEVLNSLLENGVMGAAPAAEADALLPAATASLSGTPDGPVASTAEAAEGGSSPSLELPLKAKARINGVKERGGKRGRRKDEDVEEEEGESAQQKGGSEPEDSEEASGSEEPPLMDEEHDDDEEDEEDHQQARRDKAESEGEAEVADDDEMDGNTSPAAVQDRIFVSCQPLAAHAASIQGLAAEQKDDRAGCSNIFYANDSLYILCRLHQTLSERIYSAKMNARIAEQKWRQLNDRSPPDLYNKFISSLHKFLDGSTENAKFEDECRAIIGTQSYVLFTLDKLIYKLVKQLQLLVVDEVAIKMLQLHAYEQSRKPAGSIVDLVYHANAATILHDESAYRLEHTSSPSRLSIQLMDVGPTKLDVPAVTMEPAFAKCVNDFTHTESTPKEGRRIYLSRNAAKYDKAHGDEEAMLRALETVEVRNGLECKMACGTCKVSYVLDTEDVYCRRRWQAAPGARRMVKAPSPLRRKGERFAAWLANRAQALAALDDGVVQPPEVAEAAHAGVEEGRHGPAAAAQEPERERHPSPPALAAPPTPPTFASSSDPTTPTPTES